MLSAWQAYDNVEEDKRKHFILFGTVAICHLCVELSPSISCISKCTKIPISLPHSPPHIAQKRPNWIDNPNVVRFIDDKIIPYSLNEQSVVTAFQHMTTLFDCNLHAYTHTRRHTSRHTDKLCVYCGVVRWNRLWIVSSIKSSWNASRIVRAVIRWTGLWKLPLVHLIGYLPSIVV